MFYNVLYSHCEPDKITPSYEWRYPPERLRAGLCLRPGKFAQYKPPPSQSRPPNRRLAESPYLYPRQKGSIPTHGGSPTGPIPPEETLKRSASPKEKTDAYRREDGVSVFIL